MASLCPALGGPTKCRLRVSGRLPGLGLVLRKLQHSKSRRLCAAQWPGLRAAGDARAAPGLGLVTFGRGCGLLRG